MRTNNIDHNEPLFTSLSIDVLNSLSDKQADWMPYSSLLPTVLFVWGMVDKAEVCEFENLLVIKRVDWVGNNKPLISISPIFNSQHIESLSGLTLVDNKLKYVAISDNLLTDVRSMGYEITEAPDEHEYILSAKQISALEGPAFSQLRHKTNKFDRLYNNKFRFEYSRSISDPQKSEIMRLYDDWFAFHTSGSEHYPEVEREALNRILSNQEIFNSLGTNWYLFAYINNSLVGFVVVETVDHLAFGHLFKANLNISHISEFLTYKVCEFLSEKGVELINIGEDLGIEGLRSYKLGYRPVDFVKTYHLEKLNSN